MIMPIMVMPILMMVVMPIGRHILIFYIVHTADGALSRLIAAAALTVHRADVGGGVFRTLLICIGFRFAVYFGLIGSCFVLSGISVATAGYNE